MSGKHPFSKLKGRNSSATGPTISFRFSRVDEELEEVSTGKKLESISENRNGYDNSRGSISSKSGSLSEDSVIKDSVPLSKETELVSSVPDVLDSAKESNGSFESADDASCDRDSVSFKNSQPDTREPAVKDSVKDYLSRFGRRAASLDSDSSSSETEVWPFLKDLKGRIARNIEEKISKDIVIEGEIPESLSFPELKGSVDPSQDIKVVNPPVSVSSQSDIAGNGDDHLSPSVEATETLEVQKLFEKLFHENKSPDSEQKSPISDQRLRSPSPQASGSKPKALQQIRKRGLDRPEFNMTLSSLMASRSFSFEDVKADNRANVESSILLKKAPSEQELNCDNAESDSGDAGISELTEDDGKLHSSKLFLHKLSLNFFKGQSWSSTTSFVILVTFILMLCPIPSAMSAFFIGCIITASVCCTILKPPLPKEPFKLPDYENMPPLVIEKSSLLNDIIYKGWMNELSSEYNPDTYHVNCTNSVYIRLDGSYLRISHPKVNIPKRAMFNEPRHELAFVYQRHYDVTGALVTLLPEGLYKKRLWSKKYPICITIPDPKQSTDSIVSDDKESSTSSRKRRASSGSKDSSPARRFEPKPNENGEIILYLFARTDREKYDWYHRFLKSSRSKILKSYSPVSTPNISSLESQFFENKRAASLDLGSLQQSSSLGNIFSVGDAELDPGDDEAFAEIKFDKYCKFEYYMSQLLSTIPGKAMPPRRSTYSKDSSDYADSKFGKAVNQSHAAQNFAWLNALIGRLFFDFLTEDIWAAVVAERIQRKLSKLKLPNFIEELKVSDIHLGSALPKIHRASNPVMDDRGMWIDIDVSYNGSFQMTLETKLNLLKLQRSDDGSFLGSECKSKEMEEIPVGSRFYDSEEDDSAESSSDEDVPLPEITDGVEDSTSPVLHGGGSTGKKLIRLVDKIAQSSYFQSAAKNKYIKRAMEEVSNMPLMLTVEVHWLIGTLAINIPPMPTDRLWYGFRKNPQLSIVARPKLGCRAVRLTHVTEWIEKKLVLEFQNKVKSKLVQEMKNLIHS